MNPLLSDDNSLAVFGLLFKEDTAATSDIFDTIDFTQAGSANFNTVLTSLIANKAVYHYKGSLTTPTCGEVVNWFVMGETLPIKTANLNTIKAAINSGNVNSRDLQQLNGRTIYRITEDASSGYLQNIFPTWGIILITVLLGVLLLGKFFLII